MCAPNFSSIAKGNHFRVPHILISSINWGSKSIKLKIYSLFWIWNLVVRFLNTNIFVTGRTLYDPAFSSYRGYRYPDRRTPRFSPTNLDISNYEVKKKKLKIVPWSNSAAVRSKFPKCSYCLIFLMTSLQLLP